jgi:hypothetical protein
MAAVTRPRVPSRAACVAAGAVRRGAAPRLLAAPTPRLHGPAAPATARTHHHLNPPAATPATSTSTTTPPLVRLVALVPAGVPSPVAKNTADWGAVLAHEAVRLAWADASCALHVFEDAGTSAADWDEALTGATAVIIAAIPDEGPVGSAARALLARPSLAAVPTVAALGCGPSITAAHWRVRGAAAYPTNTLLSLIAVRLPWTRTAAARATAGIAAGLWARAHSDDALAALALVIDAGGVPMASAAALKGQGLGTLICMLRYCRAEVLACVTDPSGQCGAALKALSAAPPGDAVAAYRAITSYECDAFSAFSLCVLQKHGCLGARADVPARPVHPALKHWRGEPLTHETAQRIFVGWLQAGDAASWHVAAGQNPAYDTFANQIQLFYYGAARGAFWYDPVFQVTTLDGRTVWRRRHYRVRPTADGPPGTFWFSVLDSGVVSLEYWTIVDAADDLTWALFAYRGAAGASGQTYVGSVLCSRDGAWPREDAAVESAIEAALERAGVKVWEMFETTNTPGAVDEAPLAIDGRDAAADPVFGPSGGGRRARPVVGVEAGGRSE